MDELIKILNPESNYVFYDDAHGFCINTQDVLDHLCAMQSAQPTCTNTVQVDDCISREAAIEAMRKAKDKSELHRMLIQLPSPQPGWTYIEEELPKTIINQHTHDYQEYNCLCDFGDNGFDVRTYKFGNGHFWNGGGIVDKYVTAWQPLPEIPDALKPKPWEGEKP